MNTDIYCEIDQNLAEEICVLKAKNCDLDPNPKSQFAKWLNKTKKWREKCMKRMWEKPWSAKKDVWIAPIK